MSIQAKTTQSVHVIGGGMAGTEAAWQLANQGIPVTLHEMRPERKTDAHKTDGLAELVCSNSFRSDDHEHNAIGLIHEEMRQLGSVIMQEATPAAVPAGGALAVDRDIFSAGVTKALEAHPLVTIERGEVKGLPPESWDHTIIATGPLTSPDLAIAIQNHTGEDELSFFDAIAPIVATDSINMDIAWKQSRYDKTGPAGTGADYINCPMTQEQYEKFIHELKNAEYGMFKDWEKDALKEMTDVDPTDNEIDPDTPYFDGCMPIEVMAKRGDETLRFGPMKPVGLTNPRTGEESHAVVQLRQDNALGTIYNMVGFQTKMKYGEQARVFKMIPGLEEANFVRLGGLHRNTFINSPRLLDDRLCLPTLPRIRFAGQITGCEGYVESAALGLICARMLASDILGQPITAPPTTTAMGAILNHVTGGADAKTFQPMNVNFGLFDPLPKELATEEYVNKKGKTKLKKLRGIEKKKATTDRAKRDFEYWKSSNNITI